MIGLRLSVYEQSLSSATSLATMQEPQEVMEETVTVEEDPGTPTSHVSVVTSEDGTTRRTETKVKAHKDVNDIWLHATRYTQGSKVKGSVNWFMSLVCGTLKDKSCWRS